MSEVRNIPRLRFPEFEKIWDVNLFSDFYEFQTTNSYSRDNLNYEYGKLKNIHYGDIHTKFRTQFIVNNEDVPYINDDIDISKIKTNQILKEGDLVIADASEDYSDIGKSIDKYSSVVTLEEIGDNDYNLNIPRYVDTFEEEEDVDLEEVSGEIQSLEKDLSETNQTIQSFCKELNISTPF